MKSWLCCFIVVLLSLSIEGGEPNWKQTLQSEYAWSKITETGTLLVSTKKRLLNINPVDGKVIWQRDDMASLSPFNVSAIPGTPLLLINEHEGTIPPKTQLQVVNVETGESLWDTGIFTAANLIAIPIPSHNLVLFGADHIGAPPWYKSDKDFKSGAHMSALKLDTGEIVYDTPMANLKSATRHRSDTSGGWIPDMDLSGHPSVVIEDNIIYLPFTGLTAMKLDTGEIVWDTEFKTAHQSLKFTNAQPVISGDIIYTSGVGRIYAVNKSTGEILWNTKVGRNYAIPELLISDDNVIGRIGGSFSNGENLLQAKPFGVVALKRDSGKKRWLWKKGKKGMTNIVHLPERNWIMVADRYNLYALDTRAKKRPKIAKKVELEFKRALGTAEMAAKGAEAASGFLSGGLLGGIQGGFKAFGSDDDRDDPPTNVSIVGGDLIVRGQYHLLSYDTDSKDIEFSIAFEPPGMNGLALAAMGAVTAVNTLGNTGLHSSWGRRNMALNNSLNVSSAFTSSVSQRYAKSEQVDNLAFFLTTKEEGLQLIGINLVDGSEVGAIPMDEKEPQFMVDNISNTVYYMRDGKEVIAYPF